MPRFSEREKERIRGRLHEEGERLFTAHGLKKVTIDDLVAAVHIAKATFYTFYDSKEALYFAIVQDIQRRIFTRLDEVLEGNAGQPGKRRVMEVFGAMYRMTERYPILAGIDRETADIIGRKIPDRQLAGYLEQNEAAVMSLMEHGIRFTCDAVTAGLAFRSLYYGWLGLGDSEEARRDAVCDILLRGVVEQIVTD